MFSKGQGRLKRWSCLFNTKAYSLRLRREIRQDASRFPLPIMQVPDEVHEIGGLDVAPLIRPLAFGNLPSHKQPE